MRRLFLVLTGLILFTAPACQKEAVKPESEDKTVNFKAYLFIYAGDQKYQADSRWNITVNQNVRAVFLDQLFGQKILELEADVEAGIRFWIPNSKTMLKLEADKEMKTALEYLGYFFESQTRELPSELNEMNVRMENQWIQSVSWTAGDHFVLVDVQKRFEDGKPRRLKIASGGNSLIIDILEYKEEPELKFDHSNPEQLIQMKNVEELLMWIGENYG